MSHTPPTELEPDQTLFQRLAAGVPGAIILIALVLVCYNKTLTFDYIWDDDAYVVNNTHLNDMNGLSRLWTHIGATPQYYPVTFTSFWIERQIVGESDKAAALSHAVNLLLHAVNAVLLWTILRKLLVPGAWLAAALFAVHPINVESVAWVSERKNVLSLALGLSALLVYLRYAGLVAALQPPADKKVETAVEEGLKVALPSDPGRLYLLFLGLFALALLAKTTVAVLPAVILIIVWWKRGTWTKRDIVPLIIPFILAAGAGLLTSYIERNPYLVGASGPDWDRPLTERLALLGQTNWFYFPRVLLPHPFVLNDTSWLGDTNAVPLIIEAPLWLQKIAPMPLMFNYPKWVVDASNPVQWIGLAGLLAVLALLIAFRNRIGRGVLACCAIYFVCLLPASGLFSFFPMQFSWVADHFAYTAVIGLLVLISGIAATIWARIPLERRDVVGASVTAIMLIGPVFVTVKHLDSFGSLRALWQTTLLRNPSSWMAASNLGTYWQNEAHRLMPQAAMAGPNSDSAKQVADNLNRADIWLKYAQKRNPNSYQIYHWQALLAAERGNVDDAIALAQKSDEVARLNGSKTWIYPRIFIADLYLQRGDIDKARPIYEEIEQYESKFGERLPRTFAGARMARARIIIGRMTAAIGGAMSQSDNELAADAIEQYDAAIALAPEWAAPKIELARILIETGSLPMGLQLVGEVITKDRNNPDAKFVTALAALKQNQPSPAGAQLANLIQSAPEYWPAYVKLAEVLVLLDRKPEAIDQLKLCLRLNPRYTPARQKLAELEGVSTQPTTVPFSVPQL